MMNNEHDRPDRVLAAVARLVHRMRPVETKGVAWEPVPGGYGFVPLVVATDVPRAAWTLPRTDVTVAQLQAQRDRLVAEGLGSLAGTTWTGTTRDGSLVKAGVTAWGGTSRAALRHLIAGVRGLWPDLRAAVDSLVDPSSAWAPGETRVVGTELSITAPRSVAQLSDDVLWMLRSHVEVRIAVRGADWAGALRRAAAVSPLSLAVELERQYTDAGCPDLCRMPLSGRPDAGSALVAPTPVFRVAKLAARMRRTR